MKLLLLIAAAIAAASCASGLNAVQADCEARSATFPALASCLQASYRPSTANMQLYLARAAYLSQEVTEGRMSDSRARLELAQMRADIARTAGARLDRALDRQDELRRERERERHDTAPPTTTTDCYRDAMGNMHCTSRQNRY